jgi:PAS domain S-box-containing protein
MKSVMGGDSQEENQDLMKPTVSHLGFGVEHEARLYQLLVKELTEYAIFFINLDGRIASWNSGVERILGYAEADFLGQPFSIFFTPEDQRAGIPEQELALAEQNGSTSDDRWHVRKNGERFFVSGRVIASRNEAGDLVGCAKIMRDQTVKPPAKKRRSGGRRLIGGTKRWPTTSAKRRS